MSCRVNLGLRSPPCERREAVCVVCAVCIYYDLIIFFFIKNLAVWNQQNSIKIQFYKINLYWVMYNLYQTIIDYIFSFSDGNSPWAGGGGLGWRTAHTGVYSRSLAWTSQLLGEGRKTHPGLCHKLKFPNPYIYLMMHTFNISNLDYLI